MKITKNQSLFGYNSFGINALADEFVEVEHSEEIAQLVEDHFFENRKTLFLGGGNNIVFVGDFHGTVVHLANKGIAVVDEDSDSVTVRAEAGEVWDDFVWHCLENQWYGLENLVAIPSSIGAAAVQNIGAYGVEAKDFIVDVEAIDIATGEKRHLSNADCQFGYRDSVFKHSETQCVITAVSFRLSKTPQLRLSYKAITDYLSANAIFDPTPKQLAQCIADIRWSKLPKPEVTGSAGSFFKNPVVTASHYETLKERYPDIVAYPAGDGFKLAAGWLIEKSGWKGRTLGRAGVYPKQALVLVNCGDCDGNDVVRLANAVIADVEAMFGVRLQPEAIMIGGQ
ncbi:MAG: UDP-N-acetylmuramate dehydrogenase [Bacteroidales bacterium]|nr:UDP-N-acetylmuramate dehydrogenase [Bacteroidales bacterium]MBP5241201.1 UDP-N-acetylmuramate dehydrogenase [Bacteroidales bacterium]